MIRSWISLVEYTRIQKIIESSRSHKIHYISKNPNFDFPAVYLISNSRVIYVGETNSLYHRMGEHQHGIGRYSLLPKLEKYGLSVDMSAYHVQYIKVEEYRERKFTEDMLKSMYRPYLNYRR